MDRKVAQEIAFIAVLGLYFIFSLDGITGFDYAVDEPMWVHYGKVQQNQGFILDTENAPPLPFWLFGLAYTATDNPFAPRFANIIIFLLAISATMSLLKNTGISQRKKLIMISATILNPYFILYSRLAMTDIIYFAALWLSILSLYISLAKKSEKHLYISAIFFALSSLTKHISLLFWPLFIILVISRKNTSGLTGRHIASYTIISATGFILMATADLMAYTKTGDIYSFAGRVLAVINAFPFISLGTGNAQGALITSIPSLVSRTISYAIAILIYTAPLVPLAYIRLKKGTKQPKKDTNPSKIQKKFLILVFAMFAISVFLKEGYMRQLIIIYPLIYLIAAQNTTEKRYAQAMAILIIYCIAIDINAFTQKDSIIFGSSKDFLENVPYTKTELYNYMNSNTGKDDIVLVENFPDNLDAKSCQITGESLESPPEGTSYIIISQKWLNQNQALAKLLEKHTLEETIGYKNSTSYYYVYAVNQTSGTEKSSCLPVAKTLLISDLL